MNVSSFFQLDLWALDSNITYCVNHTRESMEKSRRECQESCQQNSECVGILHSLTAKTCYICHSDVMDAVDTRLARYRFYRKPGNKLYFTRIPYPQ